MPYGISMLILFICLVLEILIALTGSVAAIIWGIVVVGCMVVVHSAHRRN